MTAISDDELLQQIFEGAELIMDALDVATACLAALEAALVPQPTAPAPVVSAARHYLLEAWNEADRIARLTFDPPV